MPITDYTAASVPSTMNMTYGYGDGDPIDIPRQNNGNWPIFDNFRFKRLYYIFYRIWSLLGFSYKQR